MARLKIMAHDTFSSLRVPSTRETTHYDRFNVVVSEETVPVRTLSSYLPTFGTESVFLKVDTQGNDLAVLEGACGLLSDVVACQIEVPSIRLYEGVPNMAEHFEYMERAGFNICGMFPVSKMSYARVLEFDAIFVNAAKCDGSIEET